MSTAGQAWTAGGTKKMKLTPTQLIVSCDINNAGSTLTTGDVESVTGDIQDLLSAGEIEAGTIQFTTSLDTSTGQIRASTGTSSLPSYDHRC